MFQLSFDPRRLPRSMSRNEWREVDRWRRKTQKQLAAETQRQIVNLIAFGRSHPEISLEICERLANPVLLIGPYQD